MQIINGCSRTLENSRICLHLQRIVLVTIILQVSGLLECSIIDVNSVLLPIVDVADVAGDS
jgi:hypothetical protein